MESRNKEASLWEDIIRRIEIGESQTGIARENGLSIGQFRYRLKKYIEHTVSLNSQVAAAAADDHTEGAYAEAAVTVEESAASRTETFSAADLPEIPLMKLDASLLDESWQQAATRNRLTLMVKEPTTVFAYWELTSLRKRLLTEHFQCAWEKLPFFLQVYDVTDLQFDGLNAHHSTRIGVHPQSDTWYIHDLQPGRRYIVDFGTTTLAGHFFTILRSNVIETPPMRSHRQALPYVQFGSLQNVSAGTRCKAVLEHAEDHLPMAAASWQEKFSGYNLVERRGGGAD